jgi:hypothetical protein
MHAHRRMPTAECKCLMYRVDQRLVFRGGRVRFFVGASELFGGYTRLRSKELPAATE